jgi:voltage-gated potassium channel
VLLTTNDDAMNIYLAVYCRKLNPDLRIVSRITHERNVEAIHRAGADFVLSYTSLGVDSIMSLVNGDATVMLGEGVRLFEVRVPPSLAGQPLSKTGIGSRTGLSVVAIEEKQIVTTQLTSETLLPEGGTLLMLGNDDQRRQFAEAFEQAGR